MANDESSYISKRRDYSKLVYDPTPEVIAEFLEEPFAFVAEFVTGMLADGPKQWSVTGGKIIQAALKGHVFEQVAKEVRDLRKKGKLNDDFGKSKYGYQSWVELLTIIDNERPDPDRLEALKAMFFSVNSVNATDAEKVLAYQLFQIAKQLTSSQLLLLKACYELGRAGDLRKIDQQKRDRSQGLLAASRNDWLELIQQRIGHPVRSLIERDEEKLLEFHLLSRENVLSISISDGRLSDLGDRFCRNIETYEIETSEEGKE
jgi:hypothetical protein